MWVGVSTWNGMTRVTEEIMSHVLRCVIMGLTFTVSFWGCNDDERVTHGDLSRRLRAKAIDTYSPCLYGEEVSEKCQET